MMFEQPWAYGNYLTKQTTLIIDTKTKDEDESLPSKS